jgi:hypothetical protein
MLSYLVSSLVFTLPCTQMSLVILFADDDVKLNSMTFRWPEKMGPIFELGETRIAGRRDEVERTLTKM